MIWILVVGVGLPALVGAGYLLRMTEERPPEIPSPSYFMERDWQPADEVEQRRRTVRAAIEDWQESYERLGPSRRSHTAGPWKVVERQRENLWGTMVGIAPEATNGKQSFCFGAAYPDMDDFAADLERLRDLATEKCRVLNETEALADAAR